MATRFEMGYKDPRYREFVGIKLQKKMLENIDRFAKEHNMTRTDVIRYGLFDMLGG